MFKNSLQARFIVPVSTFVTLVVLGSAIIFSILEKERVLSEVDATTHKEISQLKQLLTITDAFALEQAHSSMRLLIERGTALGDASVGADIQVGNSKASDLLLGAHSQANTFDLVDGVTRINGGTATLFVKRGADFVRISTNVKTSDGDRAVGTILDPTGKAIQALRRDTAFYGQVEILGNPYLTGYEPIRDKHGNVIGAWYVGYHVDMEILTRLISRSRLLTQGFMAIVDDHGRIRFHSDNIDREKIDSVLGNADGWKVSTQDFSDWGFRVVAAYSIAEVDRTISDHVLVILSVGGGACLLLIIIMHYLTKCLVLDPLGGDPVHVSYIAAQIAAGDLTVEIEAETDDHRSMMSAIRRMRDGLRKLVLNIYGSSARLILAADSLVTVSDFVSSEVLQQNRAIRKRIYEQGLDNEANLVALNVVLDANIAAVQDVQNDAHRLQTLSAELKQIVGGFKI